MRLLARPCCDGADDFAERGIIYYVPKETRAGLAFWVLQVADTYIDGLRYCPWCGTMFTQEVLYG